MSLRARLFGAICITLCVVLGVLVAITLVQARERAERLDFFRRTVVSFATEIAASASGAEFVLRDTVLVQDGTLHPALMGAGAFRGRKRSDQLDMLGAWGSIAAAGNARNEALRLVREAVRTGATQNEGDDAVAVVIRHASEVLPDGVNDIVYLRFRPVAADPVEVSRATFLVLVVALGLLLLITWLIVDRVVARPLDEVTAAAKRVADGDYTRGVPSSGGDDAIQQVIRAFNAMMLDLGRLRGRLHERIDEALTEARKTEESLVIAQRLAATGQLAAGIAHEVNNPLGGMLNAVHSLRSKEMTDARRAEYFDIVDDGLRRIQATVAKILQFTPHKVAPQPVDLSDVVRPVYALVRHRAARNDIELEVELSADAHVFGDPYELQQSLLNVVLNALDAVAEAAPREGRVSVRTEVDGDEVRLLVRDNGIGMAEDDVPRAFDLFFTTKETGKGSGLGLATAHKIVTDHGGRLELLRRAEGGMEVSFTFPRLHD